MILFSLKLANHCFTHLPLTRQQTQTLPRAKEQKARSIQKQTTQKMIAQSERDELLKEIKGDTDYKAAAVIYEKITGRNISWRYLYKFLTGERTVTGNKQGGHQPLKMWACLVEAVVQRKMEAERMTMEARAIRERLRA